MPSGDYDYKVKIVTASGDADWSVITVDGIDNLSPAVGDVLEWNGTQWINTPSGGLVVPAYLRKDQNLADVADVPTARTNLGLGSAATHPSTDFDAAGAAAAAQAASSPKLTPTAVKTGAYNAAAGDFVPVDTTSAPVTITLPTAPADGSRVGVKLVILGGSNAVTIARGGTDVFNKAGGSTSLTLTLVNQAVSLQYKASSGIWYVVADDEPLSGLDARYDAAGAAAAAQAASQPLDSDLTAIAADATTAYGRALLALADGAALKALLTLLSSDVGAASFDLNAFGKAVSSVNYTTFATNVGSFYSATRGSSGAQNDEVVMRLPLLLQAGTWTFVLSHWAGSNRGQYTLSLSPDGSSWTDMGTFEGYAGSNTATRTEMAGITVAAGFLFARLKMATKNASASSYVGVWSFLHGLRTGA